MAGIVSRRSVLSRRKATAIASGCNPPASISAKIILPPDPARQRPVQNLTTLRLVERQSLPADFQHIPAGQA
jgi:hypothetical protein